MTKLRVYEVIHSRLFTMKKAEEVGIREVAVRNYEWHRVRLATGQPVIVHEQTGLIDEKATTESPLVIFCAGIVEEASGLGQYTFFPESDIKGVENELSLEELLTHPNELVRRQATLLHPEFQRKTLNEEKRN